MAVTAKFPKAGKQSAYEAGITPSGKFIPKGYQEGGYAEKYQKELESVPEKMQERLDLGMFTKKGGAYTPKGLADYLNVPLETSKFDTLSYSPNKRFRHAGDILKSSSQTKILVSVPK